MELGWQTIVIIPIILGAVIYMIRRSVKKKTTPTACPGCDPKHAACNCSLVKDELHQL